MEKPEHCEQKGAGRQRPGLRDAHSSLNKQVLILSFIVHVITDKLQWDFFLNSAFEYTSFLANVMYQNMSID